MNELDELRPIVNSNGWMALDKYIRKWYNSSINELVNAANDRRVCELQGEVKTLKKLLQLKERVNAK